MKAKVLLTFLTLLILMLFSSCDSSTGSDEVSVTLRDRQFDVPMKFLLQTPTPTWLQSLSLDDSGSEILLKIEAAHLEQHILGYIPKNGMYNEHILIYFAVLSEEEVNAYQNPTHMQGDKIWFGKGWYRNRVIKKYGEYYKVYADPKYMKKWSLLSVYPDSTKPLPKKFADFYVATCHSANSPIAETSPFDDCKVQMITSKNLLIEFSVREQNLHLLPEIKKFLVTLIESWEVDIPTS